MSKRQHQDPNHQPFVRSRNLSDDGLSWLDPQGRPPQLDEHRRLQADFILVDDEGRGERWHAGSRFTPYTPRQWELVVDAIEKARKAAKDTLLSRADVARLVEETMARLRPPSPPPTEQPPAPPPAPAQPARAPAARTEEAVADLVDALDEVAAALAASGAPAASAAEPPLE